jgi:hypothetical protein
VIAAVVAVVIQRLPKGDHDSYVAGPSEDLALGGRVDDKTSSSVIERTWITGRFDAFRRVHRSGYFIVEDGPGMGKTTFARSISFQRGYPVHFTQYGYEASRTSVAVADLADQLIRRWRPIGFPSRGHQLPDDQNRDSALWLLTVIEACSMQCADDDDPVVLVVDALDAAAENPVGHMPLGLPDELPAGVFVIATTRTGGLRHAPATYTCVPVAESAEANIRDLREFLAMEGRERYITDAMESAGTTVADFTDVLVDRSDGVWVYVRHVLDQIRQRPDFAREVPRLPRGLASYYDNLFNGILAEPADRRLYEPLLAALAVASEPVRAKMLASFSGINNLVQVEHALGTTLAPFCSVVHPGGDAEICFKVFHDSLREYMTGVWAARSRDGDQLLSWAESLRGQLARACHSAHSRICDHYLSAWGGLDAGVPVLAGNPALAGTDDGYALGSLAAHLLAAERATDLHRLLACGTGHANTWFTAHDSHSDIEGYLRDVRQAQNVATSAGAWLRYRLIEASISSRSARLPPNLLSRLVSSHHWTAARAFSNIQRMSDEPERVRALAAIAPVLPSDLHASVLSAALRCQDPETRATALYEACGLLSGDLLAAAADAGASISDPLLRAAVVTRAAARLPPESLASWPSADTGHLSAEIRAPVTFFRADDPFQGARDALATAREPDRSVARDRILAALIPYLPGEALDDAITALEAVTSPYDDASLVALGRCMPAARMGELLTAAARHHPGPRFFQNIASKLQRQDFPSALDLCRAQPDARQRRDAFIALTACMDIIQVRQFLAPDGHRSLGLLEEYGAFYWNELLPVVSALINRLPDDEAVAQVTRLVIPRCTSLGRRLSCGDAQTLAMFPQYLREHGDDLRRAVITAISSNMGFARRDAEECAPYLVRLAPFSPREITFMFDIAGKSWWDGTSLVLADELAPHIPDHMLEEICNRLEEFPLEPEIFRALAALAPYTDPEVCEKAARRAFTIAEHIGHEKHRARAVAALAPLLSPDLAAEAFECVRRISQLWIAPAMDALAPVLPQSFLETAPSVIGDAPYPDPAIHLPATLARLSDEGLTAVLDDLLARLDDPGNLRGDDQMSGLLPYLNSAQARRAWQISVTRGFSPELLTGLVDRLPQEDRPAAANQILALVKSHRFLEETQIMGRLAQATMTPELADALSEFLTISQFVILPHQLAYLSTGLPQELAGQAFQYIRVRPNPLQRNELLAVLAPNLPADLLTQAIAAVAETAHNTAAPLAALGQRLPPGEREPVLTRALQTALDHPWRAHMAGAIQRLISQPGLTSQQRTKAIAAETTQFINTRLSDSDMERLDSFLNLLSGTELEQLYITLATQGRPEDRVKTLTVTTRHAALNTGSFFTDGRSPLTYWPTDINRADLAALLADSAWWISSKKGPRETDEIIQSIFDVIRWWK